jgi:6-methylsalicylate decarboxylase
MTALQDASGDPSGWTVPEWTILADRDLCSAVGVSKAYLSATAPGPDMAGSPEKAAALARQMNEAGAAIVKSDPEHYGFFASVPTLLAPELAIAEIRYALDTLHAAGIILMTRYGDDNHYLGHPDFIPIWEELNAHSAVVFIHPTSPLDKTHVNSHLPGPMFDYPQETGRTAMDMITQNRMPSVRNCKIILSHAGGTMPYTFMRAAGMLPHTPFTVGKSTEELLAEAREFYYDTAISSNEFTLGLLFKFAKPGHVLFGTDFPNAPREGIEYFTKEWDKFEVDKKIRDGLDFENAKALFGHS